MFLFKPTNFLSFALLSKQLCSVFNGHNVFIKVGVFNAEGPPVPIPNTEVKLCSGENTCLATDRKDSSLLTQSLPFGTAKGLWIFRNPLKNFTRKSVIYNVFQVARLSKEDYLIFLRSSVGRAHDC